jgi:hypothetical protein
MPELSIFELYGSYKLDNYFEMVRAVEPLLLEFFEKNGIHVLYQFYNFTVAGLFFVIRRNF